MDDAEEQAQADEEAEAAAAEALVETTLEMVDAKKCAGCATSGLRRSRCAGTLSRTATSARTMRRARPAVRGREGASARGARAAMLACHEAPSMAGHTLVSFALELSVYACMCVYM